MKRLKTSLKVYIQTRTRFSPTRQKPTTSQRWPSFVTDACAVYNGTTLLTTSPNADETSLFSFSRCTGFASGYVSDCLPEILFDGFVGVSISSAGVADEEFATATDGFDGFVGVSISSAGVADKELATATASCTNVFLPFVGVRISSACGPLC